VVICLERGADLHMAQLTPLPLTVSRFSKIQIGFTFLVPVHPGSPGQRAVKRACVCVCVFGLAKMESECLCCFNAKLPVKWNDVLGEFSTTSTFTQKSVKQLIIVENFILKHCP